MPSGPLFLLPTEHHVERALLRGERAKTFRAFVRQVAAMAPTSGATREMTRLATGCALASLQPELGWGSGPTVVGVLDDALGALRSAGASADALLAGKSARPRVLGRLLRLSDERLVAAHAFDDRAVGFVAA